MMRWKWSFVFLLFFLLILGFGITVNAQEMDEDEEQRSGRYYPVNFSLYYPVSLNQSEYDSVNFNLSLIYGKVGSVRGLDISAGASAVSGDLLGLQLCGLVGVAGESGKGIQAAGLISVAGESFLGVQTSGLITVAGQECKGLQTAGLISVIGQDGLAMQVSGLASVTGENLKGFQASGLFSVVGAEFKGVQASGLFNVTGESCYGIQAAGLFSVTGNMLRGLQASTFNVAAESEGLQVGVVNVGGSSRGVQIGVVNYTQHENTGFPFGLVNLAENGSIQGTLWGGNSVAATAGVKFNVHRLYSIVSIGLANLNDNIGGSLTYGFHYGGSLPLGGVALRADLGYRYRDNKRLFRSTNQNPDQFIFEGRVLLEIPIINDLAFVVGGGLSYIFDTNESIRLGDWKPILVGGIEFFNF